MKYIISLCTGAAILMVTCAQANHCDGFQAEAQAGIYDATLAEPQVLEAAQVLLDQGVEVCAFEEQMMLEALAPVPSDPEFISMGQSMLINAGQLASGQSH
jgi:hypothetical protein